MTPLEIIIVLIPSVLTVAGAIIGGFSSIRKEIHGIRKDIQSFVTKEDCRHNYDGTCERLDELRGELSETKTRVAILENNKQ